MQTAQSNTTRNLLLPSSNSIRHLAKAYLGIIARLPTSHLACLADLWLPLVAHYSSSNSNSSSNKKQLQDCNRSHSVNLLLLHIKFLVRLR
jgi:hypothetical protein